jgi:hypothetical protein
MCPKKEQMDIEKKYISEWGKRQGASVVDINL